MSPSAPSTIRSAAQIRALASPVRQEILDAIEAAGPSTVADLAAALARRPDALYFHAKALEKSGLLRRAGIRGEGRTRAAVFDVPARPMRIDYTTPRGRAARLGPVLDALLRLARRDTRRALNSPDAVAQGPARDLWVARFRGRVTPAELARINALLEECSTILRESRPGAEARPVALAFALTPLAEELTSPATSRRSM
jgi:DNA-binding transcriptional ArsR family regulator